MRKSSVLLADDHAIVLSGLQRLLDPVFEVVGAVRDGQALVSAAQELNPEVIVTDIAMPGVNGIQATRQIRTTNRAVKIVFLTMYADMVYVKGALSAGGSAYVLKSCANTELVTAIQEALLGRRYVTPSIPSPERQGRPATDEHEDDGTPKLTARQREVLCSIAAGHSAKETAALLKISSRTAEFHKYQLMQQLGVRSVAELTRLAIRYGILDA